MHQKVPTQVAIRFSNSAEAVNYSDSNLIACSMASDELDQPLLSTWKPMLPEVIHLAGDLYTVQKREPDSFVMEIYHPLSQS